MMYSHSYFYRLRWMWGIIMMMVVASSYGLPVHAAVNKQINYQGKLANASGTAVSDGTYAMEFNLYTQASGGSPIWTETLSGANEVQVTSGLFSVMLGAVSSLNAVDFNQTLYLGINVEGDGEMTPRKTIGAVPAAFVADTLDGLDSTQFLRSDTTNTSAIFTNASTTNITVAGKLYDSTGVAGSNGQVLKISGGLPVWGSDLTGGAGTEINWTYFNGSGVYLSTTTGQVLIGDIATTSNQKLEVVGGAYLSGNVGIGTTSPYAKLSVDGRGVFNQDIRANYFTATSTSVASTFPYASTTALSVSGTASTTNLVISGLSSGALAVTATGQTYAYSTSTWSFASSTLLADSNTFSGTNLFSGTLRVGSLNGPLQANNGTVSATTSVGVLYGGTGLTTAPSYGQLLLGNSSGGYTLTATSSLGLVQSSDLASYLSLAAWYATTSDQLTEGSTHLYWSNNRFDTRLAATTTLPNLTTLLGLTDLIATRATTTNATTTNFYISNSIRGAGLTSCSAAADKLIWNSSTNQFGCATDAGAGGGITALGAQYSTVQTGSSQTFATSSDTNILLTITSAGDTHTFTPSWTGTLAATRGGTGISSVTAAGVLLGNYAGTGWQQLATSSLGLPTFADLSGYANFSYPFPSAATSTLLTFNGGLTSYASTTIGAGTQTTGLTISGGATTTGNAYFGSSVGIGSTSPNWKLSVAGDASFDGFARASYFTATSTSVASTFPYASTTALSVSGTASTTNLVISSLGGASTRCLQVGTDGTVSANASACGSGSSALTSWSTTTSQVAGRLINYSNNTTDIVAIGNTSTTTAPYWFDPNTLIASFRGNVGIGTTSPYAALSVAGLGVFDNIYATSTTATSTFAGGLNVGNGDFKYEVGSGVTSISNLQIGAMNFDTDAGIVSWMDLPVSSSAADGVTQSYSANIDGNALFTVYAQADGSGGIKNSAVGIGTTSPYAKLSVDGRGVFNQDIRANYFTATSTSVASTFPYASTTALSVSGTASTTNLVISSLGGASTRCLQVGTDGTVSANASACGSGSGTFSWTTTTFGSTAANATSTLIGFNAGLYSLASSTIGAGTQTTGLTISGGATTTGNAYFGGNILGGTGLMWDATNTRLGIGTTSPYAALSVVGLGVFDNIYATSTTATSTFAGGLNVGAGNLLYDLSTGVTSAASFQTGNLNFDTDAGVVSWADLPLSSASNGSIQSYTASLNGSSTITVYGISAGSGWLQGDWPRVAIGSSTLPSSKLTVFANGTGTGGTFELVNSASTTLVKVLDNGSFGIGSTSPWRTLSVNGTVALNGLTSSATGNAVCITASKDITDAGGGTCTPSSERFKTNIQTLPIGSAIDQLSRMRVVSFDYKDGSYSTEEASSSVGLIAEEVEKVNPILVDYGYDGKPLTLHFERLTGLSIQAIQEQQRQIAALASTTVALNVTATGLEQSVSTTLASSSQSTRTLATALDTTNSILEATMRRISSLEATSTSIVDRLSLAEGRITDIDQRISSLVASSSLIAAVASSSADMIASSTADTLIGSTSFMQRIYDGFLELLTTTLARIKGIFVSELHVEDKLCVEDVCVNKDQLKALLINAGGTSASSTQSQATPVVTPLSTPVTSPVSVVPITSEAPRATSTVPPVSTTTPVISDAPTSTSTPASVPASAPSVSSTPSDVVSPSLPTSAPVSTQTEQAPVAPSTPTGQETPATPAETTPVPAPAPVVESTPAPAEAAAASQAPQTTE